jgi:kynurenine formamidase
LFRFPYLKEGASKTKVDSIRNVLIDNNYKNGYVTIDASDWYINQRLINRINAVGIENTKIDKFKKFYIQHLIDRANYYEKLSYQINKRQTY